VLPHHVKRYPVHEVLLKISYNVQSRIENSKMADSIYICEHGWIGVIKMMTLFLPSVFS
jgi:CRP-like cAMP-binding protein